jgi:hypothetical protein
VKGKIFDLPNDLKIVIITAIKSSLNDDTCTTKNTVAIPVALTVKTFMVYFPVPVHSTLLDH